MPAAVWAAAGGVDDLEATGAVVTTGTAGLARFVVAPSPSGIPAQARAAGAEARALAFLDRFGAAFGLGGSTGVRTLRASGVDAVGMEHVRLQQVRGAVPVAGAELTVHLRAGGVVAVLARTVGDLDGIGTAPTVSAATAEAAARALAAEWPDAAFLSFSSPRLELFNRALIDGGPAAPTRLAWFVLAQGDVRQQYIWIDAHTGTVLRHLNQRPTALVRQIFDAANAGQFGPLARNEGDPPTGNPEVDDAYDFSGDTYAYYLGEHGRDSYDDAGGALVNVVRSCPPDLCFGLCPCPNAFNATFISFFGDGWVTDDIVAHEWTHGVTGYAAGLIYANQSGALNESFSDIFGEAVDLTNGAGTDTPAVRWRVAEDLNGIGIRDMMTPGNFGDPGKTSDSLTFCGSFDNGGVHFNSGIPNHAFALMVDGGSFNGYTIAGIGLTKAGKIQYRALEHYLFASATLADNYNAVTQACADLIGTAGISAGDCAEVGKALDAVEMNGPWPCDPCGIAPRTGCRAAGTSVLLWKQSAPNDKLIWKWNKGAATSIADFADPLSAADYTLCIYAGTTGTLFSQLDVPASPFLWKTTKKGFKYKHPFGVANGVTKVVLKSSVEPKAKALVKGFGSQLPDPVLGSVATPVRAQLVNLVTQVCWEGVYEADDVKANDPDFFKAKSKN